MVVILALGGLVWWAFSPSVPNPLYKGKRLSNWCTQLPALVIIGTSPSGPVSVLIFRGGTNGIILSTSTQGGSTGWSRMSGVRITGNTPFTNLASSADGQKEAVAAVRGMGSNAVPFLMAKLKTEDTKLKVQVQKWAFKIGIKKPLFESALVERGRAAGGLLYVSLTEEARRELGSLATNKADANLAFTARLILLNNSPTASGDPNDLDLSMPGR